MATNRSLEDDLIDLAVEVGRHRSREEAITAALRAYVAEQGRFCILDWVGKVDYFSDYDPKKLCYAKRRG